MKTKSKTLNEVKPVENVRKSPQSYLEIITMQKEVLPLHKMQDHTYECKNSDIYRTLSKFTSLKGVSSK